MIRRKSTGRNPFEQEAPYGTVRDGYVYIPDPWTFPEGYGNAWCSIKELEKDGIKWKRN